MELSFTGLVGFRGGGEAERKVQSKSACPCDSIEGMGHHCARGDDSSPTDAEGEMSSLHSITVITCMPITTWLGRACYFDGRRN
jgi:hypothetical protein